MSRPKSGPLALQETFGDLEHYGATPTALILPDETTIEECVEIGVRLGKLESASMFWIGDLLVHSEERFGEMASQIEEATGYARATISAAKYVCQHVKPENRLAGVSFAHHKAVAAVDEELQRHWLAEALKLGLPVDGVKAAIKDLQRMAGVTTQKKAGRKAKGQSDEERSEKPQKQTGRESAALARAAAKAARKPPQEAKGAENGSEGPVSNGTGVAEQLDAMLESLTALRQAAADLDDVMVPTENMLRGGTITYAQMATLLKQIGVFDTIKHLFLQSASAISVEALKQPNAAE